MARHVDGLKRRSKHRKNPLRGYIPRGEDGAYRVDDRKDGLTPAEVWDHARKRRDG